MSQRRSVNGRPSGTDGSDFSFRMVVDSRYQKVADGKSRLRMLILIQGCIQLLAAAILFLPTLEGALIDSRLRRKRSRVNLLKLYLYGSSVAALISIVCLLKSGKTAEIIKDMSRWGTSKFELMKIVSVLLGLLVQIFAFGVSTSLIRNMAPPKRAM
ncbi:hypothetical protein CASFOL_002007 [Castilleja foliolosa]|uniref:Uncharacterized protein n=1 Tax=Castilleja foliolosa TaxID=1961234 RepID=A0ABD3ED61_9LAMI